MKDHLQSDHSIALSTAQERLPSAGGMPLKKPFTMQELVMKLLDNRSLILTNVPSGDKSNSYFMVSNEENCRSRKEKKKSVFPDDCGIWDSTSSQTSKMYFDLREKPDFSTLFKRDDMYKTEHRIQGKRVWFAVDPQPSPENIIVLVRYTTTLKRAKYFRKRVSWLEGDGTCTPQFNIAIWEHNRMCSWHSLPYKPRCSWYILSYYLDA